MAYKGSLKRPRKEYGVLCKVSSPFAIRFDSALFDSVYVGTP
jgi:hypothetical protein